MGRMIYEHQVRRTIFPLRRKLSEQIETSLILFFAMCILLVLALTITFLFFSNKNATKGYELRILQESRTDLIGKNEILSMQITEHEALTTLNKKAEIKAMVQAPASKIVQIETAVARK